MSGIFNSSIGRKFAMALSALFLMIFLLEHFIINLTSVFSGDVFNNVSQYMGTNWLIQFIMQPILIFAVVFHFVMGFILEIKNKNGRIIESQTYTGNITGEMMLVKKDFISKVNLDCSELLIRPNS